MADRFFVPVWQKRAFVDAGYDPDLFETYEPGVFHTTSEFDARPALLNRRGRREAARKAKARG